MTGFNRCSVAMAVLTVALATPAGAQENFDSGKTGAQLFASDCALCHASPQGLAKSGGLLGLSGFLREHYTASQASANVIAKYLESLPNAPPPAAKRGGSPKRTAKGDEKTKLDEKKPGEKKPEVKSGDGESPKSTESKPRSSETKSGDAKPAETKPETKPETQPPEAKASEPKPDPAPAAKPEAKPDTPEKSD